MEITFLVINGLLTFYIGKRLMPGRWALIPAFILLAFPGFWHKVFLPFGLLLSLLMLLRFLERRTMLRNLCVGWAAGITLVFRIEAALFSSVTILVSLFCYHIWKDGVVSINKEALLGFLKESILFGLAMLSILIPVLACYHYHSGLGRLFHSLKEGYGPGNIGWVNDYFEKPDVLSAVTRFHIGSLKTLFFFLTVILYLYAFVKVIIHFFVEKREDFPLLLPVLILGVLSLIYPYIAFSKAHLLQVAAMSYVLFSSLIYSFWQRKGLKSRIGLVILILLLGLHILDSFRWSSYFASGSISRLYMIRKGGARLISSPKAKIYVENKYFGPIEGLIRFFEGKNGYLMSLDNQQMVNFLTGLPNPSRHALNLTPPLLKGVAKQSEIIGDIERYKIKYLLIRKLFWEERGEIYGFRVYAPVLYEFVLRHYRLEKEVGTV